MKKTVIGRHQPAPVETHRTGEKEKKLKSWKMCPRLAQNCERKSEHQIVRQCNMLRHYTKWEQIIARYRISKYQHVRKQFLSKFGKCRQSVGSILTDIWQHLVNVGRLINIFWTNRWSNFASLLSFGAKQQRAKPVDLKMLHYESFLARNRLRYSPERAITSHVLIFSHPQKFARTEVKIRRSRVLI